MTDRPPVITVPTELDRRHAFYDLVALALVILTVKYLSQFDLHWYAAPLVIIVGVWALSGEPAEDVQFVGILATGVRSKLGLRRAHEWVQAWAHYFRVAVWPRSREQWQNSRLRSAITTSRFWRTLQRASGAIHLNRPARFWSKS